ncbi:MAG: response regulator [Planctomycetota bacterium]|nr:response regulator [Planctomycetota bacterium]
MNLPVAGHVPYARIARKLVAPAALVALATGLLVLLGWLLDIPSLKSVLPGFVAMKANTAVGFVLAGMSLALFGRAARSVPIRRLSQACAGATALLGLLTLGQYLFALNFGIDQVLFRGPAGAIKTLSPGRMAPSTALNFLLLGSALLLAGSRRGIRIAQPLALLAGWIGLLALIGYLYGDSALCDSALCGIGIYTQMAVHTAVTFVILGFGVLLARPAEGFMRTVTSNTTGGLLIRRIMPFVVVLPVVLGWLRLQGEEHGYFDSTFGVALMMIVIMLAAMGVTWWTAGTLNRIDMALLFKTMLLEAQSETSPDGILTVDQGGKSILFNKRFGELWKIPQHIMDTGDDGKMLDCILGQLKDPAGFGRKVAYLYEHHDEKSRDEIEFADGRCFDRYSSPLVAANGKYYGRIWYFRDITDRKRMEHELRRLAVIAEQAAEGIAVADLDGNLQFVNHAWARMHGFESGAELVGKPLSVFHTDEQFKAEVAPFNATVKRQGHHADEVGHVRKDGSTFPTQMSVVVLKDEQGEPYGIAGFAEDITSRKQAEQAIRRAKEDAEVANAAKSDFLANMSHEIRTPMTAILGFTEMIGSSIECCTTCAEHQACPTRVQNKESIQIIRRNGEHLLELINDILDISKIEAGKFVMDVQPCSLPAVIADVISLMRVRAEQHNISLSVEYETEIPETVRTDGTRVRQALVNLIGNAIKFTERGGVRLVVSLVPAWRGGQPAVRVKVIDTGIGIDEEKLSQLFQPFAQADASTSRKYGGTGLGLPISRHFAELLGGELVAEGTIGMGSTFTLTIPTGSLEGVHMLKDPAEAAHGDAASLNMPAAGGKVLAGTRILVAEDGPDNQRLIRTILSTAGAEVELAADGREAVAKAQAASFDVVLMDMQMPGMDGYEATRTLRAQGYAAPILALTAHAMTGDRDKCLAAGCTDHLTKPIDRRRLIETVAQHAGKQVAVECQAAPTPESPAGDPQVIRSQYAADPDLAEVLGQFVAGLPGQIEAMSRAAQAGRREELQRLAHRLKGAGGSYGYPSLTEAARELEVAARAGDVEAAGLALGRLTAMSRAIVRGMVPESVSKEVKS